MYRPFFDVVSLLIGAGRILLEKKRTLFFSFTRIEFQLFIFLLVAIDPTRKGFGRSKMFSPFFV